MVEHLLIALVVLLVGAKLGGALAERFGQPAVLGELLAGVLIGALPLVGFGQLSFIATNDVVDALADLGVILLLFEVGLSTRLADLMKVGLSAFLVATVGVVAPMILGYFVGVWLLPDASSYVHVFLGATLSATSVGITARVLQDMGKVKTSEGQIILGCRGHRRRDGAARARRDGRAPGRQHPRAPASPRPSSRPRPWGSSWARSCSAAGSPRASSG